MRRATALVLCALLALGTCTADDRATVAPGPFPGPSDLLVPQIPAIPQPDATQAIEAIAKSDIPAEMKPLVIDRILASIERNYDRTLQATQEMYREAIARRDRAGAGIKEVLLSVISVVASIVGITLAASK